MFKPDAGAVALNETDGGHALHAAPVMPRAHYARRSGPPVERGAGPLRGGTGLGGRSFTTVL